MGGLVLKNGKGRQVGRAQTPLMWDAEVAPHSGEHVNHARVGLRTVAGGKGRTVLELTPDTAFLARPDLTFPVTIDPPTSLSAVVRRLRAEQLLQRPVRRRPT